MRDDEHVLYLKMAVLTQGQDLGLASNAAMNLVAAPCCCFAVARTGGARCPICGPANRRMVKVHWRAQDTGHHGSRESLTPQENWSSSVSSASSGTSGDRSGGTSCLRRSFIPASAGCLDRL